MSNFQKYDNNRTSHNSRTETLTGDFYGHDEGEKEDATCPLEGYFLSQEIKMDWDWQFGKMKYSICQEYGFKDFLQRVISINMKWLKV